MTNLFQSAGISSLAMDPQKSKNDEIGFSTSQRKLVDTELADAIEFSLVVSNDLAVATDVTVELNFSTISTGRKLPLDADQLRTSWK
jgi:hypothetical protein